MSKKGVTKYRIQKNGIDICKLVFTKAKDLFGRFDLKIVFYDKKYDIRVHKLFSYKSERLYIDNIENKQISYHYGREDRVKIQLRNIVEHEVPEEIVYNLVPPNDYSIFPIPLFKIEVPSDIKEPESILNSNKQKHEGIVLELGNNNTAEIYMSNPNDNKMNAFKKYEPAFILEALAPIEYFASNGGKVGYEKHRFFYDETGNHIITKDKVASDFNLMINEYDNKFIENKKLNPTITFIENELYEDIILNTSFNPIVSFDEKEERIQGYLNGGKDCFNFKDDNILIKDTVGERIWKTLKGKEKEEFFDRCIESRNKLGERYISFINNNEINKEKLKDKVNLFLYIIVQLNQYYIRKYNNKELGKEIPDEILWMIEDPILRSEEINILLGKYLGIDNFRIFKTKLSYMNKTKKENHIKENENDVVYLIDDIKNEDIEYCYLEYNSSLNIHISSYSLNGLIKLDKEIPLIDRSNDLYVETEKWKSLSLELKEKGYYCTHLEFRTINLEKEFERLKGIEKAYDIIINELNKITVKNK